MKRKPLSERDIAITDKYDNVGGYTLKTLAEEYEISPERIRQITCKVRRRNRILTNEA